jgi:hypothetical protein
MPHLQFLPGHQVSVDRRWQQKLMRDRYRPDITGDPNYAMQPGQPGQPGQPIQPGQGGPPGVPPYK